MVFFFVNITDVLSRDEIECEYFFDAQQLARGDGTCFTIVVLVFGVSITAPTLGVLYNTRKDSNTTVNSL